MGAEEWGLGTGDPGLGIGDSGLGTRRQGYVRRSGFREAYRRMSFLTIEIELYRAGRFLDSPSNPRNDGMQSLTPVI